MLFGSLKLSAHCRKREGNGTKSRRWEEEEPPNMGETEMMGSIKMEVNDHVIIECPVRDNYNRVLVKGSWIVYGRYLMVEPWLLSRLTTNLYKQSFLKAIGEMIGLAIKITYKIDIGEQTRFAQMAIDINLKGAKVTKEPMNNMENEQYVD
ncbi:hypothetical protein Gotur_021004 [Gossypium turneri]